MNSTKRTALIPIRTQNSADPVQSGPRRKRRPPSISVISVLLKFHTGNLFVRRVRRSQNLNQMPTNMFIAATFDLLSQESEATRRLGLAQGERPSVQACRLRTMGSTIQSGDSLMSVMPSIIVLAITALVVFHRELTAHQGSKAQKSAMSRRTGPRSRSSGAVAPAPRR